MSEVELIRAIKAHIAKGDKAAEKSEQHYISAGLRLKALKATHAGNWAEWEELLKTKIGIGKSRASELMQIADGRKTFGDIRAVTAERTRKSRQSSPLRSGEEPGEAPEPIKVRITTTTETVAPRVIATIGPTPTEDDPGDDDQTIWRRGLVYRAKEAIGHAAFEDWSQFTIDSDLILVAELAADAWNKTAAYLNKLQAEQRSASPPDDGLDIPERLRRTG
jgi:hypothetical protein